MTLLGGERNKGQQPMGRNTANVCKGSPPAQPRKSAEHASTTPTGAMVRTLALDLASRRDGNLGKPLSQPGSHQTCFLGSGEVVKR